MMLARNRFYCPHSQCFRQCSVSYPVASFVATRLPRRWRVAASASENLSSGQDDVSNVVQKYSIGGSPAPRPAPAVAPASAGAATASSNALGFHVPTGVALLVLVNCGVFFAAAAGKAAWAASLALNPAALKWWSFITSALVHHNLEQLGRNMFIVYFFSQIVYHELGGIGVWFSYLLCGLGANLSSWLFLAGSAKAKAVAMMGLASTGGALGIFLAALALSFRPTLAWLLGAALSGNFVISMLVSSPTAASIAPSSRAAAEAIASGSAALLGSPGAALGSLIKGIKISAVEPGKAWVAGAVLAAAIVVLLARLPEDGN